MLLTKSFTTCEIPIDDSPCNNVSLLNEGLTNVSLLNTSSPKVVVVDMKLDPEVQMIVGQSEEVDMKKDDTPLGKSGSKAPNKPKRSGNLTPVQTPEAAPLETSAKKIPKKPKRSGENLTPVKSLGDLKVGSQERSPGLLPCNLTSHVSMPSVESVDNVDSMMPPQDMVPSVSQQSISSILSQVSVESVKSTFSIEEREHPMVVYDDNVTQTMPHAKPTKKQQIPAALGAMPDDLKEQEEKAVSGQPMEGIASSMESIDSALGAETESSVPILRQRLTKSVSIDSGKGSSIDDLVSMGVLVCKKPSEAETSGLSHEFGRIPSVTSPGPGSPLVKSRSTSNVNTCPYHESPYLSTPARLTRSQTILPRQDSDSAMNASSVQANIQMFNAMSHTSLSSTCDLSVRSKKMSKRDAIMKRSTSNAGSDRVRRRHLSDDEKCKKRSISDENLRPMPVMKSTDEVFNQLTEVSIRLQKLSEKSPYNTPMEPFAIASDYQEHNDSYEKAISAQRKRQGCLQVNICDLSTPRSLRRALGDHNVTISPSDLEKFAKDVPPLQYHPHRSEALTPIKLAKSTRVRTPGGKNIIIRHSPSGRSSPGKPIKRLHTPSSGLHHRGGLRYHHHHDVMVNQGAPTSRLHSHSKTPSRRYPTSPGNPSCMVRASSRSYPKSPSRPLAVQQYLTPRRTSSRPASRTQSRASSIPPHVEEEIEWRV